MATTNRDFRVKNGLIVEGDISSTGVLKSNNSAPDEGGEIQLALPSSGSTLSNGVTIDVYQNKLRIFETGGDNQGAYIDLSAASAGVGSNLLAGGGSGITDIVQDTTPQLGGDLDAQGNNITNVEYVGLDTTPATEPTTAGSLWWSSEFETANLQLDDAVTLQVGQEHLIRVKNASGSTAIPNGTVVMFAGATGDTVAVSPAVTDGTYPAEYIVGITTETIPADGFGFVTQFGYVNGVNTSSWTVGTILYPNPSVAGGLTSTEPSAPATKMRIAAVTKQNASSGRLLVRTIFSPELEGNNNVEITSPTNGQTLTYSDGVWINSEPTSTPFEEVGVNGVTWVENEIPQTGPISIVGTSSTNFGNATSGNVTLPSGMQEGDTCFVLIGSDNGNPSLPADWTVLDNTTSGTEQQEVAYKVMSATPDIVVNVSGLSTASAAVAIAVRGVGTPTKATATGTSGMPNPAAISVTTGDLVIIFGAIDDDNIIPTVPDSSYSNLAYRASSTVGQTVMLATKIIATTGTENPGAFGGEGTDDWVANIVKMSEGTTYSYEYNANYDAESSQVKLNTSNSPTLGPSTLNFRWNSTTSLNTQMSVGQSLSCAYIATEGSTAPSIPTITIDGNAQTVLWAGGSAPVPTANTKTSYVFSIIKTADATFTVIGSGVTYA